MQIEILDVLSEGRATPGLIIERVDGLESQQQANYHLRQLRALGHVERVQRGLYELDESINRTQREVACPLCDYDADFRDDLQRHIIWEHSAERAGDS